MFVSKTTSKSAWTLYFPQAKQGWLLIKINILNLKSSSVLNPRNHHVFLLLSSSFVKHGTDFLEILSWKHFSQLQLVTYSSGPWKKLSLKLTIHIIFLPKCDTSIVIIFGSSSYSILTALAAFNAMLLVSAITAPITWPTQVTWIGKCLVLSIS